ncbi:MAG: transglutaminase family protein [Chlamydiota bacterium]
MVCFVSSAFARPKVEVETIYTTLDPHSISQLLAFYSLYPEEAAGQRALKRAWALLQRHRKETIAFSPLIFPPVDLAAMIAVVNPTFFTSPVKSLTKSQLQMIEKIADHLSNRRLKGFSALNKAALVSLPSEEIDLARALLIYAFDEDEAKLDKIRTYEANLDLMALQILAYLPLNASDEAKIQAINRLIFYDQKFRFPPHSLWVHDVDLYTLLPAVLDSRRGVCLGVSVLYLALAQRLNLSLEIITPPGHIYLRYKAGEKTINIETTARGISPPSKVYLGINTNALEQRSIKEVIGLTFINQASSAWQREHYAQALALYQEALLFLPENPLLRMLLGYQYLLNGQLLAGIEALKQVKGVPFEGAIYPETLPEDFLTGKVDVEGIKAVFLHVDETRTSILAKQTKLKSALKRCPKFRNGLFHLAITYLQLGRRSEALAVLNRYHELDAHNPVVEYYLAILSIDRFHYHKAWQYLKNAEAITAACNYTPQALRCLRHRLRTLTPDPATLP